MIIITGFFGEHKERSSHLDIYMVKDICVRAREREREKVLINVGSGSCTKENLFSHFFTFLKSNDDKGMQLGHKKIFDVT